MAATVKREHGCPVPYVYLNIPAEDGIVDKIYEYIEKHMDIYPDTVFYHDLKLSYGVGWKTHACVKQLMSGPLFSWKGFCYRWELEDGSRYYRLLVVPTIPDDISEITRGVESRFVVHGPLENLCHKGVSTNAYTCIGELKPGNLFVSAVFSNEGRFVANIYDLQVNKFCYSCFRVTGVTCSCVTPVLKF